MMRLRLVGRSFRFSQIVLLSVGFAHMSEAANAPLGGTVAQGSVGSLGEFRAGVMSITQSPPQATIGIFGASTYVSSGTQHIVPWEATHIVHDFQQVMAGKNCFGVLIDAPAGGGRGSVGFGQVPTPTLMGQPWPDNTAVLDGDGGTLRLNGPETQTASDLRVIVWQPDETHPTSADIEWVPLNLPRGWLKSTDVKTARLTVGSHVEIGASKVEVLAIEGKAALHPARIIFHLTSAP